LFVATSWLGCGLDPETKPLPPPPEPNFPPESPLDVIENMEYAYNQMDYEWYWPLLHEEFVFEFNEDDVLLYPDDIPPEGVWGKTAEMTSAEHMLDRNFVPADYPERAIDNIELELDFSGDPVLSNLEGAPEGTMEAFVTFDLRVTTVGEIDYWVNSRPLFYFTPLPDEVDGEAITRWYIWYIQDAPFDQN
jgi:hypothetical protein